MVLSPFDFAADFLEGSTRWRNDPADWIRTKLGDHPWSKQTEILESVRDHSETVVRSCHGAGKSFIAGRTVAWWLEAHPPGSAVAVTTAPTFPQVRAILWKEIRRARRDGKLRGRVNQTEWLIAEELVAFGRKPADYDQEAFQGIHAEFVLVVIDEAAGIPDWLWDAAGNLATTSGSRILAIGNPDVATSEFARRSAGGPGRNVIGISVFDTPNFTDEVVPDKVSRVLVDQSWVDKRRHDWGEDDPRWVARVLGEFPTDDELGVVPYSHATACSQEPLVAHLETSETADSLGVDVGAGGDETVIFARYGRTARKIDGFRSEDATETAERILRAVQTTQAQRCNVDTIGIGWGVVGRLREYRDDGEHAAEIVGVNVGEASTDTARFPKLRDQIWWEVGRELSQDRAWSLVDVDDEVIRQLTAVRWSPDTAGRVKVEPKAETKKRLGRSPDDADALLLAFYAGAEVAAVEVSEDERNHPDPYAAERRSKVWD